MWLQVVAIPSLRRICIYILYVKSLRLNCHNGSSISANYLTVAHFLELQLFASANGKTKLVQMKITGT